MRKQSRRAVEPADARRRDHARIHVIRVDGDRALARLDGPLVVRGNATDPAPEEPQRLASPRIALDSAWPAAHANGARLVVRPQCPVAAADRAIAGGERARCPPDFQANGTTVTGRSNHTVSRRPPLLRWRPANEAEKGSVIE